MIDENNGCFTKSKLTITAKTLCKHNDWSRVAAKQTNKQTYLETQKNKKQKNTHLQTEAQTDLLWTHAHKELDTKNEK